MSTTLSPSQARPVGTDTSAWRIERGDVVLIEPRTVCGVMHGANREVVALVIWAEPQDGARTYLLEWVGAAPGHDAGHVTTGSSLYESASRITVLGHIGESA